MNESRSSEPLSNEALQNREHLRTLLGGVPDVVVVLGGGLTQGSYTRGEIDRDGVVTPGKKRERTSPYSGSMISEDPEKTRASGVRPRSLAAATIATSFPDNDIKFVTTGGLTKPVDPNRYSVYSGNNPSAIVMAKELELYGGITPDKVVQLTAPTSTATEVMEIILDAYRRLQQGEKIKRYTIICSGYQKDRLAAFLELRNKVSDLQWFLSAHESGLDPQKPDDRVCLEVYQQHKNQLLQAVAALHMNGVELHAVSAEDVLQYRSRQWNKIVTEDLPTWQPWTNRMEQDARGGVQDLQNRKYTFGTDNIISYMKALYPQAFEETKPGHTAVKVQV